MHANARRVRKSGDDSNRDSNVTTHRATAADDGTRNREAPTHRPVPCSELIRMRSVVQTHLGHRATSTVMIPVQAQARRRAMATVMPNR